MSVETLRTAIDKRAFEIMVPALMRAGITKHKKKWRDCPCSWCQTKREATVVIGSCAPRAYRGFYTEDIRGAWREEKRAEYRKRLKTLEDQE